MGWNIYAIKDFNIQQIQTDIVIIDESQRISAKQLEEILKIKENKIIIFSHDVHQKLNRANEAQKVTRAIQKIAIATKTNYTLNNKIRYSKEIAYFIKKIFNPNDRKSQDSKPEKIDNISLYYTNSLEDAKKYVNFLVEKKMETYLPFS